MNENRRQILQMLAEGKISADEAERLISAVEEPSATKSSEVGGRSAGKDRPKYLRVQVDSEDGGGHEGPTKVNVRVPMQLLRAGVKLAYLIPTAALQKANLAMHEKGIPVDLTQIKPENLEDLVEQLSDLTVDVDQNDAATKVKVRVFCEWKRAALPTQAKERLEWATRGLNGPSTVMAPDSPFSGRSVRHPASGDTSR